MSLFRIFNDGDFEKLGNGMRTVIALPPGRKWITVVDWTTLDSQDIDVRTWERLKKYPVGRSEGYRKTFILHHMREQLKYRDETKTIREAIDIMKAA